MPIRINSSSGGSVTLDAPATASNFTMTLPASNSALIAVAPGANGQVLTSNGSAWVSAAPTGGGGTGTGATAWANLNGTAATINASGGISSISRPSAGYYTINFSAAFTDTNYAFVGFCQDNAIMNMFCSTNALYTKTTTAFTFYTTQINGTIANSPNISFAVFR